MSVRRYRVRLMLAIFVASLPTSLRAQFVYVANAVSNTVLAYSIVATGALTPIGAPVAAAGPLTSGNIQVSQ